jgi:hypothetical protein
LYTLQAAYEKAKKQEQSSSSRNPGGMPGGFPGGMPGGFPGAGGMPSGFPGAGGMPSGFPGAGGMPGGFPGAGGMPGGVPGNVDFSKILNVCQSEHLIFCVLLNCYISLFFPSHTWGVFVSRTQIIPRNNISRNIKTRVLFLGILKKKLFGTLLNI